MDCKLIEKNKKTVISEISKSITEIHDSSIEEAINIINSTGDKFILGLGRGGLALKSFGMRLFHLGYKTNEVWGFNTPPIKENDLLIIVSCSGNTETTLNIAKKAKYIGARILLFTTKSDSVLGEIANVIIEITAPSMKLKEAEESSFQLMNSLFEQSVFLLGDIITLSMVQDLNLDTSMIENNHANLE